MNPLGIAILFVIWIVLLSVASFRVDISIAGAFASFITTGVALLLATPGLALVGSNIIYVMVGLTLLFFFAAMMRNANKVFR